MAKKTVSCMELNSHERVRALIQKFESLRGPTKLNSDIIDEPPKPDLGTKDGRVAQTVALFEDKPSNMLIEKSLKNSSSRELFSLCQLIQDVPFGRVKRGQLVGDQAILDMKCPQFHSNENLPKRNKIQPEVLTLINRLQRKQKIINHDGIRLNDICNYDFGEYYVARSPSCIW